MELKKLKRYYLRPNPIAELETYHKKEIGLGVALVKFEEFQHLFDFAQHSFTLGMKKDHHVYASDGKHDLAKKNYRFYYLIHAILDYNACYDYLLQIVYFGGDFFSELTSEDGYAQELKKCNWSKQSIFRKEIDKIISEKKDIPLTKFRDFYNGRGSDNKTEYPLANWANQLKHKGGFIIDELDEHHIKIEIKNEKTEKMVFSSDYIQPIRTSFQDIERCLIYHHNSIIDNAESLYKSLGLDDLQNLKKEFSANSQRIDTTDCTILGKF
ncbi:hypothetical protein [uncultured Bacteroides sp.]|uniref:hypothetical protein n=1 Tax=uncultured Bacteroides sp. TaxID=162156 RepID=UPI002AA69D77|nr:hypothetical protein [uncultured Bacteroides sp.]